MFKFKGISSQDMQVIIEEEEHFIARASQRYEMTEIEGRDGAIFETSGYSCVERPIYVQCLNTEKIDDILAWLDGEGEFEYKGRKTTARFYSQLEPQRSACIRIIDTTFIRDPFWTKAIDEYETINETRYKEAQGEDIALKDSARYPFKDVKVSGNSVQETREGYNLFNYDTLTSRTINGITYTINDDKSITANGTATANATLNLIGAGSVYPLSLEAGDYMLSGCNDGSKDTYMIEIYDSTRYLRCTDGSSLINFSEDTAIRAYITIKSGVTVSNLTFYPMLTKGTEERLYQPHGAMPSTSYLSQIRNCGDNINYLDNSLIVIGTVNDTVGSEPNWSSNGSRAKFSTLQLLPNGNIFTISCDKKYNVAVAEYGEDNLCIKTSGWYTSYTFTKQANTSKISIKFKKVDDTAFTQEELTNIKCKLEKGTRKTGYSTYGCGCIDSKVQNKNYASTKILKAMNLSSFIDITENSFTIDLSKRNNISIK